MKRDPTAPVYDDLSLGPVVDALQAMRGVRFVAAVTFLAEVFTLCNPSAIDG